MQRFLVDLMLMRLGRWLRLLAKEEYRTIITRDRGLFQACTFAGASCLLIRSTAISDQLREMANAGVPLRLDPRRCTLCNGLLEEIEISDLNRDASCSESKRDYITDALRLLGRSSRSSLA